MSAPTMWLVECSVLDAAWYVWAPKTGEQVARFYGPDAEARARAYHASLTRPDWSTVGPQLVEALRQVVAHAGEKCPHANTYRGGVQWTICEDCGEKWADDEGGKPREGLTSYVWQEARTALAAADALTRGTR